MVACSYKNRRPYAPANGKSDAVIVTRIQAEPHFRSHRCGLLSQLLLRVSILSYLGRGGLRHVNKDPSARSEHWDLQLACPTFPSLLAFQA